MKNNYAISILLIVSLLFNIILLVSLFIVADDTNETLVAQRETAVVETLLPPPALVLPEPATPTPHELTAVTPPTPSPTKTTLVPLPTSTPTAIPSPSATPDPISICFEQESAGVKHPVRASFYTLESLGIPDEENVNCNDDCSHLSLARFDPRMYGNVAACPLGWIGTQNTGVISVKGLGSFYCLDTGAAIKLTHRVVSGYNDGEPVCVYEVDFLCPTTPPFHGRLFAEWTLEWIPTYRAIAESIVGEGVC